MSRIMKWITGILIAFAVLCAVVVAGTLVFGRMYGFGWAPGNQLPGDGEMWRRLPREEFPRDGIPWHDMPMRPFRAYPGRILPAFLPFGGFFGGLLCLGVLGLVLLGIAALVLGLTRSRRPAPASDQAATAIPPVEQGEISAPARLCRNCQRQVADDWSHCPYCGTDLTLAE